ncbi:hypothetical protein [Parathalassolituus penaei]|uniref:Uncharacterized protein n=1 Tax=Parathalassolituus penaei TaxID=2997323 RepID=A0A9X3EHE3_9GAMM|nr:hypothetical protein [Parathalassolituus penaei]MCY0967226.1 hypothetical protein [Parathalassolituus penaei]
MKIMTGLVLAATVLVQTGCMSLAELEAQEQRQKERQLADARITCESFGFKADTSDMAQCIQTEYNRTRDRIEREEARMREDHERAMRESEKRKKDSKSL